MKKNHWITLTIGIAIVLGTYVVPAIAQTQPAAQQAQAPSPTIVAVMDVAQVIKLHPLFMEAQANLKREIDQAEADFKIRQDAIASKQKALEASPHKPGTQEYNRALEEITNNIADFERDARNQQRKFALANSQIMYDTYKDIKKVINTFAIANGIAQVTDYREFEPNPANPQEVAEDMDQRLVWFNPGLNITEHIIRSVYAARGLQPPARTPQSQVANPTGQQPLR